MVNHVGMPNYVDALKEIRRVSRRALAGHDGVFNAARDSACGYTAYAAVDGFMISNMQHLLNVAGSVLDVCGELYWSKSTKPDDIAEVIRAEAEELLECSVTVERTGDDGDEDVGYELITDCGNFCFVVRLEGLMWRVYRFPMCKPLKNVKELIAEGASHGVRCHGEGGL